MHQYSDDNAVNNPVLELNSLSEHESPKMKGINLEFFYPNKLVPHILWPSKLKSRCQLVIDFCFSKKIVKGVHFSALERKGITFHNIASSDSEPSDSD